MWFDPRDPRVREFLEIMTLLGVFTVIWAAVMLVIAISQEG